MKFLIVVDMQNDFISGALGSAAAEAIVGKVVSKVKSFDGKVIFTRDTHGTDYLETREGRHLPVVHCVKDTYGWQICDSLAPYADVVLDKPTFGSTDLAGLIKSMTDDISHIELCGLCTDICVISNAMLLKAAFPEVDISVDSSACAGVSAESHGKALDAMRMVQIEVN
ncbi:MAG: cysteine hydrolase [Ruminococcaceae bacterium]|nr:cysteine hydrolase [Oscillospiraceae bacterium]